MRFHTALAFRYRAARHLAESTDRQRRQIEAMLPGWRSWASSQPDLSQAEKGWRYGSDEHDFVDGFDRADIAGVTFSCARQQQSAKAKGSTVMVRLGPGEWAVGQVRLFMRWLPPWATSQEDALELADVQWFGSKGNNAELCNLPQVTRAFESDPTGNLCLVEEIVPSQVCLVPHLSKAEWWQILFLGDHAEP